MNLPSLQSRLRAQHLSGWLFCDFHNRDHIAYRVLGLDITKPCSRRWFYFVPAKGAPRKLVHAIEPRMLAALPGRTRSYASLEEMRAGLKEMLGAGRRRKVAMQYSPLNNIPSVSLVDAGTVELVVSCGVEVVSSADLVQRLYSVVDARRFRLHQRAGTKVQRIKDEAFALIFRALRRKKEISELDVQNFILRRFKQEGLVCGNHLPIVAANEHAADPHFEPTAKNAKRLKKNDRILIDLWAKLDTPDGIYYDITWCGFLGEQPPAEYARLFAIAVRARDAALDFIRWQLDAHAAIRGWQVDRACRGVIEQAGLGKFFIHRTGHSIDTSVHGEGANIDSLETRDDRELIRGALFSIEPGLYKDGIGVRTEINAHIGLDGKLRVEGAVQKELILMP